MVILLASIAVLILLIAWLRLHAFVSLIIVALLTGLAAGLSPVELLKTIQKGVGDTMGGVVLILGFGVLLGNLLSITGVTAVMSKRLLEVFGERRALWALALTGFFIGLAMFYNAGFVVLAPFVFSVARQTGQPLVPLAIAMAAPLSITHCFLPPHPGATVVVNTLHADMGKTLLLGLVVAVPPGIVAAILFPKLLKNIPSNPPKDLSQGSSEIPSNPPSFGLSFVIAVLPVLLMAVSTAALLVLPEGYGLRRWLTFAGDSSMAVMIAVLALLFFLVYLRRQSPGAVLEKASGSLGAIAGLVLIIAAGGAYKQVLLDAGIGQRFASLVSTLPLSPLILGWLVASAIRITIGSATVAGMTAAGIVLPLVGSTGTSPELMALAIGAGSVMCSHVNDAGFWMFREWFGLSVSDTFKTWTVMETLVGVIGLIMVLGLNLFL
jgi:Gnt-I system high-affinity gluconate transporter/Gnt-II system L-idonate transporter